MHLHHVSGGTGLPHTSTTALSIPYCCVIFNMEVTEFMKNQVTLAELREYLAMNKPSKVIFSTEEQRWYNGMEICNMEICFENILICEFPNLISLQSEQGELCLNRVRYAEIEPLEPSAETKITVFCGGNRSQSPETSYTLISA